MSEFRNGAGKPVVALDIDGSLGDYHSHFLWFAAGWFGRSMPDAKDFNPGLKLWEHMGVDVRDYQDCKLAYRQGGMKRTMPAYPGVSHLTWALEKEGVEVWICTTRPYLKLDNIDPDTREWLRRNEVQYDNILFGEDKYRELVRQVDLNRIVAILEDLPEYIDQANEVNIGNIYIRDQPYNKHVSHDLYKERIFDNRVLWANLQKDIDEWRGSSGNL